MDPIDEAFARRDARQATLVLKILLLLFANGYLLEHDKGTINLIFLNVGTALLWFALWLRGVSKTYEANVRKIQTCSNSAGWEIKDQIAQEKRAAMRSAIKGVEW